VVSAAMGDYKTAIVLGVVIFINTVIGFWQVRLYISIMICMHYT
jgi:hypothetical protein